MHDKINLDAKFGLFNEYWRPKVIAVLNSQEIKLIKGPLFVGHPYELEREIVRKSN